MASPRYYAILTQNNLAAGKLADDLLLTTRLNSTDKHVQCSLLIQVTLNMFEYKMF